MRVDHKYEQLLRDIRSDVDQDFVLRVVDWLDATNQDINPRALCASLLDIVAATIAGTAIDLDQATGVAAIYALHMINTTTQYQVGILNQGTMQ